MKVLKGSGGRRSTPVALLALLFALAALVLSACGSDDNDKAATTAGGDDAAAASDTGLKPINEGKLTVGMNLQFEPQMYLKNGEPAGYDVDLLNELVSDLGVELNIQNLDFNGLIPGLQSNKFDMVSVGLAPTEERRRVVDFTRGYVPYAQVLAVRPDEAASITTVEDLDEKGKTIVALQGSTGEQLARELFSNANVNGLPDQNAAFLEVATGRADGIIVEDYLLARFLKSNEGRLEKAALEGPLSLQYGSWAVPKGNEEFIEYLDNWLCTKQEDGTLERLYKQNFETDEMPEMPAC